MVLMILKKNSPAESGRAREAVKREEKKRGARGEKRIRERGDGAVFWRGCRGALEIGEKFLEPKT